ncbi:MAG: M56 family metallopeptidase, partial [Planctomycetota bacterium]
MTFVESVLWNTAYVSIGIAILWSIEHKLSSAALRRALWLVLLAKLLLPFGAPIFRYAPEESTPEQASVATIEVEDPSPVILDLELVPTELFMTGISVPAESLIEAPSSLVIEEPKETTASLDWGSLALALWAAGAAGLVLLMVFRALKLSHLASRLPDAHTEVQSTLVAIAGEIGVDRIPRAKFTSEPTVPFLWAYCPEPLVVLPKRLFTGMSGAQRTTTLAHELAHLRRNDPWWRLIQMVPAVLFWWNPLVWTAIRKLHDAEEECCDALVVETFPQHSEDYAAAIVKAGAFSPSRSVSQAAALTGRGLSVKRRILMILSKVSGSQLSRTGQWAVALVAASFLPFSAIGQEQPVTEHEVVDVEI